MTALEKIKAMEEFLDSQKKFSIHDDHSKEEMARSLIGAAQMCRFLLEAFHVIRLMLIDCNEGMEDRVYGDHYFDNVDQKFEERMNEAQHKA